MKISRKTYRNMWLLFSGILIYLIALLTGEISPFEFSGRSVAQDFESVLHDKEIILYDLLEDLRNEYRQDGDHAAYWSYFSQKTRELDEQGIMVFVYLDDTLACWSDNSIRIEPGYREDLFEDPLVFFSNAWYVPEKITGRRARFVGLIRIRQEYQYENEYLENRFHEDFSVPPNTRLVPGDRGPIRIYGVTGEFLFSLDISEAPAYSPQQVYFSLICYFAAIVIVCLFLRQAFLLMKAARKRKAGLFLYAFSLLAVFVLTTNLLVPEQFDSLELFRPQKFAVSRWFDSLGDLLVWSYLVFQMVYYFYTEFRISAPPVNRLVRYVSAAAWIILLAGFFRYTGILFSNLVEHSNISFLTYRVLDIEIHTFVGLFCMALHYAAFGLVADKLITVLRPAPRPVNLMLCLLAFSAGVLLADWTTGLSWDALQVLFAVSVLLVIALKRYSQQPVYRHSTFVLLLFLFSLLAVCQVVVLSSEKQKSRMKVMAMDLAAENDPVAELMLKDIEHEIRNDTILADLLTGPFIDEQGIYDHLMDQYFNGFWEKYDLQFTICSPGDSVFVEPPVDSLFHCYSFFASLLDSFGVSVPGSDFYFFDNLNGRISYFSAIPYWSKDNTMETTLFLELDSRMVSREPGYPELLLSGRFRSTERGEQISYAKYHRSQLITRSGQATYSLLSDKYTEGIEEFEFLRLEGYKHLIYNPDENNTIIVSMAVIRPLDVLITFTYIFMFCYLCVSLFLLIRYAPYLRRSFKMNVRNRIQYSLILILVFSLLLIGGGSIYYSVRQYKRNQYISLTERIQSVYADLMHRLAYEEDLTDGWQSDDYRDLNELLRKFSNVFYTDIHLYDATGRLIATSRPEIFEKGLQGTRINPEAYYQLAIDRKNEFVNEERIGSLSFLSAYVPFFNIKNRLLAYLNLPYFIRQDVVTREISNLVVGIVNFYVLLISVSLLVAVFISVRITQPLQMLQSKFGKITLGKTNEKIDYESDDEIGALVREYNHMVEELARSAELLARSERESAWREMARQIAHEIKNPLTPMKLSVQHLKRSWKDHPDKWGENLERITQTLIEQIDSLSSIATEFSNFAQMPRANNEKLDLAAKIKNTVELFEKSSDVVFVTEFRNDSPLFVYADKEQLSSVFINLVKNAIQAIPPGRKGLIGIVLERVNETAVVRITDNGKGIPGEMGDKLFQPNFTTKSGGMGLGLAIVKNVIDNLQGKISYETTENQGTTFIVELPLYIEEKE